MQPCEDDDIERAAYGDREAFRRLWEAHHAVAMAAALRICQQRTLAEEITQGAFLLAWRGLPRFHLGQPFRPWLMRILYRHALDTMERQRHHLQPLSLEALTESEGDGFLHDTRDSDFQEQIAQREALHRVLAQLKPEQRQVLALRFGADLPLGEIAHILGWSIGTVKSRLHRACARCRELWEGEAQ